MKCHRLNHNLRHYSDVMANHGVTSNREEASVHNNCEEQSGNLQHITASQSSKPLQINIEEYTKERDNILHPGDTSLGHMYRTNNIECTSHPTIKFDGRGHLYYSNRIIFSVLFILLFTGFGTVILVYAFTLERALPKKLVMVASISLVLILAIWATCRIFEYCIWRKRIGRWHDTPEAANEISNSGQKCLNHLKRVRVNTLEHKRGCYRDKTSPLAPHKSATNLSREIMRRRGAGKFWLSRLNCLCNSNKFSTVDEGAHHLESITSLPISNEFNTASKLDFQEEQSDKMFLFIFLIIYTCSIGICTSTRPKFSVYRANLRKVIQISDRIRPKLSEYSTNEMEQKFSTFLHPMIKQELFFRENQIPANFSYSGLRMTNITSNWYHQKRHLFATPLEPKNIEKRSFNPIKIQSDPPISSRFDNRRVGKILF